MVVRSRKLFRFVTDERLSILQKRFRLQIDLQWLNVFVAGQVAVSWKLPSEPSVTGRQMTCWAERRKKLCSEIAHDLQHVGRCQTWTWHGGKWSCSLEGCAVPCLHPSESLEEVTWEQCSARCPVGWGKQSTSDSAALSVVTSPCVALKILAVCQTQQHHHCCLEVADLAS